MTTVASCEYTTPSPRTQSVPAGQLVVFVPVAFVQTSPPNVNGFVTFNVVKLPSVAKIFVEVTFVVVAFVKIAVEGFEDPIAVPLIEPPLIVALPDVKLPIVAVLLFNVVPVAVVNVKIVAVAFVKSPLLANKFVLVVFVPVAFVQTSPPNVNGFVTFNVVKLPSVAKIFVEVTFVDVTSEKIAVDAFDDPIDVPLMEPPLIVALPEVKLPIVAVLLFNVVPVAVVNVNVFDTLNAPVDVPPAN